MTKEEIKELLPIMQAFAEGKTIEYMGINGQWVETDQPVWGGYKLRIKPEPKYRPFKSSEECWNEMLKHKPFGWVKSKKFGCFYCIVKVLWSEGIGKSITIFSTKGTKGLLSYDFDSAYKEYTFADDTPFGIREE